MGRRKSAVISSCAQNLTRVAFMKSSSAAICGEHWSLVGTRHGSKAPELATLRLTRKMRFAKRHSISSTSRSCSILRKANCTTDNGTLNALVATTLLNGGHNITAITKSNNDNNRRRKASHDSKSHDKTRGARQTQQWQRQEQQQQYTPNKKIKRTQYKRVSPLR